MDNSEREIELEREKCGENTIPPLIQGVVKIRIESNNC